MKIELTHGESFYKVVPIARLSKTGEEGKALEVNGRLNIYKDGKLEYTTDLEKQDSNFIIDISEDDIMMFTPGDYKAEIEITHGKKKQKQSLDLSIAPYEQVDFFDSEENRNKDKEMKIYFQEPIDVAIDSFFSDKENVEKFIAPFIPIVEDGYTPRKGIDYVDGYTPIKGKDYFDGIDGETPKKGIDYFTNKEILEIKKALKKSILEEMPDHATKEEVNIKFEDILKKIKNLPKGGGGALFLRQLMDVNVGTPTAQQYGLTYSPSRSEFALTPITGGGGGSVDSVNGQTGVVVLDQDDIEDGTTYKQYSATEKTKLAGIETGAEVNTIDTVSDTTEIDLTITARDLTATIRSGSIDESKLDTSVNASLDLADSALQSSAIGVSVQAYSSVLQNTTASFTTTDETKLDNITVTQAVNLDTMESDIAALANGMVYKGDWDASAGTFPGAGSAQTGWFYTVSVGGTVDSVVFNVGDRLIATTDNASTTTYSGNWTQLDATDAVTSVFGRTGNVVATNGDYTASNITNVPAGNIAATDVQAALNELDGDKQATLVSGTNIKTVNSTSLLGSGNLAVGNVTKVGTPVNNQVGVWTGDGTIEGATRLNYDDGQIVVGDVTSKSASYDVLYGYSSTNAFLPMVRLQKVTFGSVLSLNAYSQSPVIDAGGGNTFVNYSQTDTSTPLANSYAGGATLSMRNDNDNYATFGIKGVGSNQNSSPSSGRAYSYGLWGTAQGHTSGNGGAAIYGEALSANIDGLRVDLAGSQTAPAINVRNSSDTSIFVVDESGNIDTVGTVDGRDIASDGALLDTALQPSDIASGTITARADDINFSGGSDGDVLTVQADGSLALETPSGGVSDGDKGDITVSGSGATWTIDDDAVTYSKIQNVAGDNVLLGNNAGAGGVVDELTASEVRTIINVEDGADVTDTTNVTAAGALMDSEVSSLSGIKTLTVPDSTTITAAAATVLDDTTVGAMVDTLGGASSTGTGGLVRATSPTLVTPALGTPSALVGTNITGTASGLTSGITNALKSATTTVNVSSATAPSSGQVLTATSDTAATWQTPGAPSGIGWSLKSYSTSSTGSISITGLDLTTDLSYRLVVQCNNRSASGTFRIAINNETGSTHYRSYYGYKIGTGAVNGTASGSAPFTMGGSGASSERHFMTMDFMQFSAVRPRAMYQYSQFAGGGASDNEVVNGLWENSDNTNITRIDFSVNTGTADWRVWVYKQLTS